MSVHLNLTTVNMYSLCISGAIFDQQSLQAHTAFRYEIEKHNNGTSSLFKLDKYEKIISLSNNYALHRASKYFYRFVSLL